MHALENRLVLEEYSLQRSRSTYLGDHTALCNVLGEILMYVDTRDVSISPHLMHKGIWEAWVTLAIGRYVKRGMYCLDIGANMGYYSLLMASSGARIEAFEPNPRLADLMKRSISVNGRNNNITLSKLAISDISERTALHIPKTLHGGASIVYAPEDSYAVPCTTKTLDNIITESPDFIKCDIEGADIRAWRGMRRVWESAPNLVLCIECLGEKRALYDEIASSGARIRIINNLGNLVPANRDSIINSDPESVDMLWVTHS